MKRTHSGRRRPFDDDETSAREYIESCIGMSKRSLGGVQRHFEEEKEGEKVSTSEKTAVTPSTAWTWVTKMSRSKMEKVV